MMHELRMVLAAAGFALAPATLSAQVIVNIPPGTVPRTIPTAASVVIGGAFSAVPTAPALAQTTQQANLCNPGFCASGSITVQANQRWQAQVRVKPTAPATFYVNWITPAPETQVRLSTAWYTIRTSPTSSSGSPTSLLFNANRVPGNTGVVPSPAQLASYLEYRVIALP